ncbi:hypothetical protein DUI87_28234 [Hirundo rustica rustica]|uniref:Coiled-coil domain-containing protein 137 n=1 Tax=Hirundo rustica rustica TaxID=333673 RepID=A0A3M0J2F8_HIRRU|nr:hypothetical protein DUI87_28234 [Hirundo rustica rustica]
MSRCPSLQVPVLARSPLTVLVFPRKEKKDNMKPKHPDEQEIPFRLRELMRSREALKRPDPGKRRAAGGTRRWPRQVAEGPAQEPAARLGPAVGRPPPSGDVPPALCQPEGPRWRRRCGNVTVSPRGEAAAEVQGPQGPGGRPVPKFRRGQGESERSYICRMEQEVQRVLFLAENQLQREPEKEATAPEKSQRKKEFQKRKLEKARKKREEKKEAILEKSLFQDTVPFGDVVTQPPTITSRPRGRGPAEQAGRKQLLLTPRLGPSQASPVSPVSPVVSMARRRILEEERARVIQAYRDIQRRKQLERDRARAGPG